MTPLNVQELDVYENYSSACLSHSSFFILYSGVWLLHRSMFRSGNPVQCCIQDSGYHTAQCSEARHYVKYSGFWSSHSSMFKGSCQIFRSKVIMRFNIQELECPSTVKICSSLVITQLTFKKLDTCKIFGSLIFAQLCVQELDGHATCSDIQFLHFSIPRR